jgi:tripartite-type tricarboxylate transporter receptor subunit TctC
VHSVKELSALAKANPGKLTFASSGVLGASHLAGELFKIMAGISIVHVPYTGGGPALTAMLGGQVQVMILPASFGIPY